LPQHADVLLGGIRRIATILVAILIGTAAIAAVLGLLFGASVLRSIAVGYYVVAAALLVGCFVMGARGPLRGVSRTGETTGAIGARSIRRATEEERTDATRTSLLLFGLAIVVIVVASLIDPAHPVV
jgi:hypothetical protein